MTDPTLLKRINVTDEELDREFQQALGESYSPEAMDKQLGGTVHDFTPNAIVKARVVSIADDRVEIRDASFGAALVDLSGATPLPVSPAYGRLVR